MRIAPLVAATFLLWPPAWSAAGETEVLASDRRAQDIALCLSGLSGQERTACLREAEAAYASSLRGAPTGSADAGTLARNREERCQRLPDTERSDCLARMRGEGTQRGSVESGGVYRELITPEPPKP